MQTDSQQCNTQKVGRGYDQPIGIATTFGDGETPVFTMPQVVAETYPGHAFYGPCGLHHHRCFTLADVLQMAGPRVFGDFSKCRDWSWNWGNLVGSWMEELSLMNGAPVLKKSLWTSRESSFSIRKTGGKQSRTELKNRAPTFRSTFLMGPVLS